jgi:hypothetical protein
MEMTLPSQSQELVLASEESNKVVKGTFLKPTPATACVVGPSQIRASALLGLLHPTDTRSVLEGIHLSWQVLLPTS